MGIEEGLGKSIRGLDFVVTKIEGGIITTDCYPKRFNRNNYAPFDYKVGQRYTRDIWENGEFVISEETGEVYLVPEGEKPIKVEGSLDEFIEKIQAEGKQTRFRRFLSEGKIIAKVRTHSYSGESVLLEIVLVGSSDSKDVEYFDRDERNPFEAYSLLVNLKDGSARIVQAECKFGRFDENIEHLKAAKPLPLPEATIEIAKPHDILSSNIFKALDHESMVYIRENCYRTS